ncbi:MAG: aminopeptidase P family protein [Candidatus Zixiibacteriota bacterium]|nr:MAG: aminopeptidase P family protein [candidate division Zixibacteria bacterium]
MDLAKIQQYLAEQKLDGWLMADFHARNNVAVEMLGLSGIVTRRSFYFIPAMGEPSGIVNIIEKSKFAHLPGKITAYAGYEALEKQIKAVLSGCNRVAMEYSPKGRLPYIGLVDAGTVELVKGLGVEVVSSADLVANFQARLSAEQIAAHRIAARNIIEIKDRTFEFIAGALKDGRPLGEYDVARYILEQFDRYDMETHDNPICGVNGNAGDPHYEPSEETSKAIEKGSLILVDLWGKMKHPHGVYADVTWMAYAGRAADIPAQYRSLFAVVVEARDAAVEFIRANIDSRPVYGADVDDVCRKVIADAGYGEKFTHRTGHSITSEGHGPGPNIDNLETEDKRRLQRGHLFSIEPGVYLDDCGFRTEINVLIGRDGAEITTLPLQTGITSLL